MNNPTQARQAPYTKPGRYTTHTLLMLAYMGVAVWMTAYPGSMVLYWAACSTLFMAAGWHFWQALRIV